MDNLGNQCIVTLQTGKGWDSRTCAVLTRPVTREVTVACRSSIHSSKPGPRYRTGRRIRTRSRSTITTQPSMPARPLVLTNWRTKSLTLPGLNDRGLNKTTPGCVPIGYSLPGSLPPRCRHRNLRAPRVSASDGKDSRLISASRSGDLPNVFARKVRAVGSGGANVLGPQSGIMIHDLLWR